MKRVPLREKAGIDNFLKRYGKKATYVDSPYLGNYFRLENSPNMYWMDDNDGNWYSDAPGFEKKGYGPVNNLIYDVEKFEPQLRKLYADYGISLADIPEGASRNKLQIEGDKRLNTYKNLVKENPDVFFHGESSIPEDALDDYEEEAYGNYYTTLEDLLDSDIPPEDAKELFADYAKCILEDKRKINEASLNKEQMMNILDGLQAGELK